MQQNSTDFIAGLAWQSTKTYWKEWIAFPAAVSAVGVGLMAIILMNGATIPAAAFLVIVLYLALLVFWMVFSTAVAKGCSDVYAGKKELTLKEDLSYGLSRFWGMLGTGLLTGLKIFLWTLLLILPGVYKGIMYSQSIKISQLEKVSGGDANRMSQSLISSAGVLRTLGNYMAIGVVSTIAFYIYLMAALLVAVLLSQASEELATVIAGLLYAAGTAVFGLFVLLFGNFQYMVYKSENKDALAKLAKTLKSM